LARAALDPSPADTTADDLSGHIGEIIGKWVNILPMIQLRLPVLCVLISLFAVGCASRHEYEVTVTNRLSDPITVWMTKAKPTNGDDYERGWMPPEVAAVGNLGSSGTLGGVVVQSGETAHTDIVGTIDNDDVAILRVYQAADIDSILSISHGSPDRLDIPLDPGKTDIDILLQGGQMQDVPHGKTGQ
jgi:hypothetical protein